MKKHKMHKYNNTVQNIIIISSTYTLYFNASWKKEMKFSSTYHIIIKQTASFTLTRILGTRKLAFKIQ